MVMEKSCICSWYSGQLGEHWMTHNGKVEGVCWCNLETFLPVTESSACELGPAHVKWAQPSNCEIKSDLANDRLGLVIENVLRLTFV